MEEKTQQQQPLRNQRSEDFVDSYANNFAFESSVWDLKIIFGQLDQALGAIDQHTGITLTWAAAKILAYYLNINVIAQEIINGKIQIAPSVVPSEPPPIPEEHKDDPAFQRLRQKYMESYAAFVKDL
jgi:hypothetical protein